MVLAYSRMLYLEFSLSESMEQFLGCHVGALGFFGGAPRSVLIDNLKTGVLSHPLGEEARFHPRYLELAAHCGFEPRACNAYKPHEKGRVENAVGYIKKNFLAGLELPSSLQALNLAARQWMDTVANVRLHGQTRRPPAELFTLENPHLRPLPALPADIGVIRAVRATNRCRVMLESNAYSVPSLYASQRLTLKIFPQRVCVYHHDKLIATHPRSYQRHRDIENPEHVRELLEGRRKARQGQLLRAFLGLCPCAEAFLSQLQHRRFNAQTHVAKIMALVQVHGSEVVARAIEDALAFEAFSSDCILNLLEQRQRPSVAPSPLHLTRRSDLLELELPSPDLNLYQSLQTPRP
jgi:hypothetical protein